ncbi:uncharacterized protein KY384_008428 [Bacidia gigantensis]|uniref:uncharacterized protein n=1 Tax=Bacidia gigantensis TaxID=2732470 RepID=UPI001D04741F|nr:uncharacterized protein KY384_008428 [Bacidia gigantensis]KAG8526999.1 hypothetical protein KY384_008428 [Bacidia gigantensis]
MALRKALVEMPPIATLAARSLLPQAGRSPSSRTSRDQQRKALTLLTATTIVFRSELAILLFAQTVYLHLHPHIDLPNPSIIGAGILGALLSLPLTLTLDTFFWRSTHPLWPELTAFAYNVLSKKSSDWGTSPYHFYFTSSLPRLIFNPLHLLLLPFTFSIPILRRPALDILVPNILYIIIYSFQPHKEWRFIVYTVPPFLAVASAGASWIWTRRSKNAVYRLLALALVASTLASFAASVGLCAISRMNYPGGVALERLHTLMDETEEVVGVRRVHLGTLACMTGITRFSERRPPSLGGFESAKEGRGKVTWVYDKEEDEGRLLDAMFWEEVDFAIAERPDRILGQWETLNVVDGIAGFRVSTPDDDDWKTSDKIIDRRDVIDVIVKSWSIKHWVDFYEIWERLLRSRITGGWWIRMKLEPRLYILQRLKPFKKEEHISRGIVKPDENGIEDDRP